jgi:hypothetical protein
MSSLAPSNLIDDFCFFSTYDTMPKLSGLQSCTSKARRNGVDSPPPVGMAVDIVGLPSNGSTTYIDWLTHTGKNGVTTITLRDRFSGAVIRKKLELACAAAPKVPGEMSHDYIFARILVIRYQKLLAKQNGNFKAK